MHRIEEFHREILGKDYKYNRPGTNALEDKVF
jgi:hypothetical protein